MAKPVAKPAKPFVKPGTPAKPAKGAPVKGKPAFPPKKK